MAFFSKISLFPKFYFRFEVFMKGRSCFIICVFFDLRSPIRLFLIGNNTYNFLFNKIIVRINLLLILQLFFWNTNRIYEFLPFRLLLNINIYCYFCIFRENIRELIDHLKSLVMSFKGSLVDIILFFWLFAELNIW